MQKHKIGHPKTRQGARFIINADDFGKNKDLNSAILKSFTAGLIHRTSLITNMLGFEDAIEILKSNPSLKQYTGIHINLTEGYPITAKIKNCKRFCHAEGYFIYKRKQPMFFLSSKEKEAVCEEIKAQIEKATNSGIIPSHIDSHHHIHTEWAISKVLFRVLKQFNIPNIRTTRNLGNDQQLIKTYYKKGFNYYLKNIAGFSSTDFFGSMDDYNNSNLVVGNNGELVEIMVHPMFDDHGELVDDDQLNLAKKLSSIINPFNSNIQ